MDGIILSVEKKSLKLLPEKNNWCQVYFIGDKDIRLGANSIDKVISGLLIAFLPHQNKKAFYYGGLKLFTIINLMDSHSVIAGHVKTEDRLELIFLNSEGNVIPMMTLTTEIKADWIVQICTFLTTYKNDNFLI